VGVKALASASENLARRSALSPPRRLHLTTCRRPKIHAVHMDSMWRGCRAEDDVRTRRGEARATRQGVGSLRRREKSASRALNSLGRDDGRREKRI